MNHIWISTVLILHWYVRLARRGECERVITIQREQYGGTIHLFIGTGHSPGEITYISLTLIHFYNTKHQGLSSLCPFSVIIMLGLHHYIKVEAPWLHLRRSFLLPTGFIFTLLHKRNFHPEGEVSCNNPCHTKNIRSVTFLRTLGGRRPPTVAPRSIDLFLCNKFILRREQRPLAEGPKKHLPFTGIANYTELWDPPNYGALNI
jgi:hypothetical protein